MKKIMFLIMFIYLSIDTFGQLPPILEFDKIISVRDHIIEIPLGEFSIIETPQTPVTIDRRVYFVHGLGGDASSWVKVSDAFSNTSLNISGFPARKVETFRVSYVYSTDASLCEAAQDVRNQIRTTASQDYLTGGMIPNDAFIIAHSQGGLVSRTLLHLDFVQDPDNPPSYGVGYGGLVTVASPLQGAMILNNRDMILDMAEDACVSLIAGPKISTHGVEKVLVNLVINNLGLDDTATDYTCKIISKNILPIFFADYYDDITNYYKVGASWIQTLNNDASNPTYCNLPKVAFFGEEPKQNIFWRTVNWFTKNPNNEDYFAANDDFTFYNSTIKPNYDLYVRRTDDFQANADKNWERKHNAWLWIFNPALAIYYCNQYNINIKKRNAWNKGVDFFRYANGRWEVVIGARRYNSSPSNPQEILNYSYYPNDGVVVQESAADLPCATNSPVRLYNSSHMQVRNDANIKIYMKRLLDGQYGDFFQTDIK